MKLTRRIIAFVLSIVFAFAATVLEIAGKRPDDQVIFGVIFGLIAIFLKEDK